MLRVLGTRGRREGGKAAATDEASRAQKAAEAATAREEVLLAAVKVRFFSPGGDLGLTDLHRCK